MQGARILLIEDDAAIATVVRVAVESEGAQLDVATTLAQRNALLSERRYDVILSDVMLPDGNGLSDLRKVAVQDDDAIPVIVLSAQNTLDTAVRAEAEGAFDYLPKPFDLDELIHGLRAALRGHEGGAASNSKLPAQTVAQFPIIGRDPAMQLVYRTLARVAPTDLSVLILGESGTGKELVAQAIHDSSPRANAPFVAVNMAAIPRELIESDLFGHEKGAFTGAHSRSRGRFEQASGGTLFLDEIGDMPVEAQTRLLRVLQSGEYSPIGSSQVMRANVRILAATNQNLLQLVASGRFRDDLYYRLNVIPIHLPPLRDRRSDIPLLVYHFLAEGVKDGLPDKRVSDQALEALSRHDWLGNVRELSNAVQRLALLTRSHRIEETDVRRLLDARDINDGDEIAVEARDPDQRLIDAVQNWVHSPNGLAAIANETLHEAVVRLVEQELIDIALERTGGNQLKAASILGINRNTLRLKRRP